MCWVECGFLCVKIKYFANYNLLVQGLGGRSGGVYGDRRNKYARVLQNRDFYPICTMSQSSEGAATRGADGRNTPVAYIKDFGGTPNRKITACSAISKGKADTETLFIKIFSLYFERF